MPSQFKLLILVPKLQIGNAVCEALASRIPETWSFQGRDTQLELGIQSKYNTVWSKTALAVLQATAEAVALHFLNNFRLTAVSDALE